MARSNTGGTRGFLRGKVAADLYQVTKSKTGKRIQLVRSVEAGRINNNTEMQALARMQMALLMGCLKQFKAIVDHSFEEIPYGQLSIAHFVQINHPLLVEDCKNNWEYDNTFDYPTKGQPLLRVGAFIMAEGSLTLPDCLSFAFVNQFDNIGGLQINIGVANATFGDLKAALGVSANDYITMLLFQYDADNRANNFFMYSRAYLADLPEDTLLTNSNASTCFTYDGNCNRTIQYNPLTGVFTIGMQKIDGYWRGEIVASCIILSVWDGVKWRRNNARFSNVDPDVPWRDLVAPNDAFASWFSGYDPDNPHNPYD